MNKLKNRCVEVTNKIDSLVGKFALDYENLSFETSVKYDDNGIAIDILDYIEFVEEIDFIMESLQSYIKDNVDDRNWNEIVNLVKLIERIEDYRDEINSLMIKQVESESDEKEESKNN